MFILNLTQHQSTPEQGCVDLQGEALQVIKGLLTFEEIPTRKEILDRAAVIADLADAMIGDTPTRAAMIGGAPFLMGPLEAALKERGITPLYAFSVRESVDEVLPDGSVRKVAVFRHKGFIEA